MEIKKFTFPSFKTWNKTRKYLQKIGSYTCAIETIAWGCDENTKNTYVAAIAVSKNPTNIFVDKIVYKYFQCEVSDIKALKDWYESSVIKLNSEWQNFILENYISK